MSRGAQVLGTGKSLALSALRSATAASVGQRLVRAPLRVLSYHTVDDADAFGRQLEWLSANAAVVDAPTVLDAVHDGRPLPAGAVWITFDDGDPSVVDVGLPLLERHGLTATLFVCPGLIEAGTRSWWRVVDDAGAGRASAALGRRFDTVSDALEHLKTLPDAERRAVVRSLQGTTGEPERAQMTVADLGRWLEAGNHVGNHTWDHPCLDRTEAELQRAQIRDADRWLRAHVPDWRPIFAYPNGNHDPVSEAELAGLGYEVAVLHDHRLTSFDDSHLRLSRLHIDAADPLGRFRSVVSGVQPLSVGVGRRLVAARR